MAVFILCYIRLESVFVFVAAAVTVSMVAFTFSVAAVAVSMVAFAFSMAAAVTVSMVAFAFSMAAAVAVSMMAFTFSVAASFTISVVAVPTVAATSLAVMSASVAAVSFLGKILPVETFGKLLFGCVPDAKDASGEKEFFSCHPVVEVHHDPVLLDLDDGSLLDFTVAVEHRDDVAFHKEVLTDDSVYLESVLGKDYPLGGVILSVTFIGRDCE